MTTKRFTLIIDSEWWIVEDNSIKSNKYRNDLDGDDAYRGLKEGELTEKEVVDLLNELHEENNELRLMLNSCSDQRSEFHRGARENANRVGKLKKENEQLKSDLKDCKKLKTKRLNKIRNHRAVIEDLGGSIRAYKGKLSQTNEKIDKIKETMEDTGALTKRQLEEILK